MPGHRIFTTAFATVYLLYLVKIQCKGRTKEELDRVICWLTGYDASGLLQQIEQETDFETFFAQAPAMHPNSALIKGLVCGVRVETVEDPLMQRIRQMDKLVDELAKGKGHGVNPSGINFNCVDMEHASRRQHQVPHTCPSRVATRLIDRGSPHTDRHR